MSELKLPEKSVRIINDFSRILKETYGDELESVILYGSASSGEFSCRNSNIDIAVILKDASLDNISRISGAANKKRFLQINPVFFTEDYIKTSADVFPIEFLDMKENYHILYGKDVLDGLKIDSKNLRFQCEQELKSRILNIKRMYIRSKGPRAARQILFKSFASVIHIARSFLKLRVGVSPYKKFELIDLIGSVFDIDTACLRRIFEAKTNDLKLSERDAEDMLLELTRIAEKISEKIDSFPTN